MTKKEKEFDFEKVYNEILERAKDSGMSDDMVFQTLMKEFYRMKNVCDQLYKGIEETGVSIHQPNTNGAIILKANPLTNEYVKAHKTLVSTATELNELLENINGEDEEEEYVL